MSETDKQIHHGNRLRYIIENSRLTVVEIVEKTGIAKSSLYDMYKKPELLFSKIKPVLDILKVTEAQFLRPVNMVEDEAPPYTLAEHIEALKRENELLKQQLAAKDEIITLLKKSKTKAK